MGMSESQGWLELLFVCFPVGWGWPRGIRICFIGGDGDNWGYVGIGADAGAVGGGGIGACTLGSIVV